MTFHNAVKYLNGAPANPQSSYSFDRVLYLSKIMGGLGKNIKYIRLAGSNGKTICRSLLTSVLSKSGYSICTLNMSSLNDPRENIRYNAEPLSLEDFTFLVQSVAQSCNEMKSNIEIAREFIEKEEEVPKEYSDIPEALLSGELAADVTKSEILLLACLLFYKVKECNLCIIESAHGSVDPSLFLNPPFISVICGAIPHNDKKQISKIKAYIQRGTNEIISAPQDSMAYKAISDTCASINCRLSIPVRSELTVNRLTLIGTEFTYHGDDYKLGLCGRFQTTNAITVIETIKVLRRYGFKISQDAEKEGLEEPKIKSRFEVLSVNPTVIADSTYKYEAVETVCESLFDFSEITGRKISLCLPCDAKLIKTYCEKLGDRGYKIISVCSLSSDESETENICKEFTDKLDISFFNTPKSLAKNLISHMENDSLLLISGKYSFTDRIRLEIMRQLEF